MIMSFLLGLLAGYLTPIADPQVKRSVEDVFDIAIPVERSEYDMLTLLIALALAALLQALWGQVLALPLIAGAFLGLFGKRFYEALTTKTIRPGGGRD